MPLLAYCLSETVPINAPDVGLGQLPVCNLDQEGVRCFYSQCLTRDQMMGLPVRQTALEFHDIVRQIFQQTAVIPFRFPTLLEEVGELRKHMEERGAAYRQDLARLRNMVQMEISLYSISTPNPQELPANVRPKGGGTQYLETRRSEHRKLADSAAVFQQCLQSVIRGWQERPSARGLRCFILAERNSVSEFKNLALHVRVPSEMMARVTGPWPASEFLTQP
jgi:hypothetical protein